MHTTAIVVLVALVLIGAILGGNSLGEMLRRAIVFLVVGSIALVILYTYEDEISSAFTFFLKWLLFSVVGLLLVFVGFNIYYTMKNRREP